MANLLLVDDDPDFRNLLKKRLTAGGYNVVSAGDGVHGLQAVLDMPLDLILLDLHLPHRGGMETLRLIRAVQPAVFIIILTGFMSEAEQAEARQLGVKDVLMKPVSLKAVVDMVGERLNVKHDSH